MSDEEKLARYGCLLVGLLLPVSMRSIGMSWSARRRSWMLTREQIARYEEAIREGRFFVYEGEEYRPSLVTVDGRFSVEEFEEEQAYG